MAVYSVSDVTRYIKSLLSQEQALQHLMVRGEISNFRCYPSGHCYFTLKDAASTLKCVLFSSRAQRLRFQPVNGLQVVATGNITVYEKDGAYQLLVDTLLPEGTGDLALAYEQLKEKLQAEGLFDQAHKQSLPRFPRRVGVVTSSAGAVLRDIYHVISHRWPAAQIVLYPVQVQGEGSAEQVAAGIEFFNRRHREQPVDVLIAGRGGGSMEDLWSFNEEIVVRAIYASKIPIISAVGHETDFTLADFAADVRAATPSQAAELAVPDRSELVRYVDSLSARLVQITKRQLQNKRLRLNAALQSTALRAPQQLLAERRQRLDKASLSLQQLMEAALKQRRHRLELALGKLDMLSPVHVLRRGYGLIEHENAIVTSVKQIKPGEELVLTFKDGRIRATAGDKLPTLPEHKADMRKGVS